MLLFWLLPGFVVLHIVEEFVFPGGFLRWYRNYKNLTASNYTVKYIVIVNCILIIFCVFPLFLELRHAVSLWLSMTSVIFFNAFFHIKGFLKLRKYSPGIVTSILLYIPLSIYGYWFFLSNHLATAETAATASLFGLLYLWYSSWRTRRKNMKTKRP